MTKQTKEIRQPKVETLPFASIEAFLRKRKCTAIELKGLGQNLENKSEYPGVNWGKMKKDGETKTLLVTNKADSPYDPNGITIGELFLDSSITSVEMNKLISKRLPDIRIQFFPIEEAYRINKKNVALIQPSLEGWQFLGNQVSHELNERLPEYFQRLSEVLHFFEDLSLKDIPKKLQKLKRNFPSDPAGLRRIKEKKVTNALKSSEQLIGKVENSVLTLLIHLVKGYLIQTGFNTYDRTPWTTAVSEKDDSMVFTNYWWAGFRDKYYDAIYFFIKTWGHALRPDLAKKWLKTHVESIKNHEESEDFKKQFFGLAAERMLVDLKESSGYKNKKIFKSYLELTKLIATRSFEKLI